MVLDSAGVTVPEKLEQLRRLAMRAAQLEEHPDDRQAHMRNCMQQFMMLQYAHRAGGMGWNTRQLTPM